MSSKEHALLEEVVAYRLFPGEGWKKWEFSGRGRLCLVDIGELGKDI